MSDDLRANLKLLRNNFRDACGVGTMNDLAHFGPKNTQCCGTLQ